PADREAGPVRRLAAERAADIRALVPLLLRLEELAVANADRRVPGLAARPNRPGRVRHPNRDDLLERSLQALQEGAGLGFCDFVPGETLHPVLDPANDQLTGLENLAGVLVHHPSGADERVFLL